MKGIKVMDVFQYCLVLWPAKLPLQVLAWINPNMECKYLQIRVAIVRLLGRHWIIYFIFPKLRS